MFSACTSAVVTRSLNAMRAAIASASVAHAASSALYDHAAVRHEMLEQPRLRGEIRLHRAVVVEMIAREIGEGRRRRTNTPSTRRWSSECDDTSIATRARRVDERAEYALQLDRARAS